MIGVSRRKTDVQDISSSPQALDAVRSLKEGRRESAEAERSSRSHLMIVDNTSAEAPTAAENFQEMIVINIWQRLARADQSASIFLFLWAMYAT